MEGVTDQLADAVQQVARRLRHGARHRLAPMGLTPGQGRALSVLERAGGPLRMAELAAALRVVPRSATGVVEGLEQLGLVRRSPDPDDGRAFRVELTDEGIEQWEASARHRMELLSAAMEGWSEEDVQTFERLMTRFADGVAAHTETPSGSAWADKGWAAVAPRIRPASPAERRTDEDFAPGGDPAPRENTDKNLESTR